MLLSSMNIASENPSQSVKFDAFVITALNGNTFEFVTGNSHDSGTFFLILVVTVTFSKNTLLKFSSV